MSNEGREYSVWAAGGIGSTKKAKPMSEKMIIPEVVMPICVIGVSGLSGSGKDEVYKAVQSSVHGTSVVRVAFADALKEELAIVCGVTVEEINANKPIFRTALQWWGTEFRRIYGKDEDYWVKKTDQKIFHLRIKGFRAFIITDVRYPNEYRYVKKHLGGVVWRIVRPEAIEDVNRPLHDITRPSVTVGHSSEALAFPYDLALVNDGTLEAFHSLVRAHFNQQITQLP